MNGYPENDRHHVFHGRKLYIINSPQYKLRTHYLMIPRLDYIVHHFELNPNIEHPAMPTEDLALNAVEHLSLFDKTVNHLEAIASLATHLDRRSYLGGEIADNLMRQLVYIEAGYVRR